MRLAFILLFIFPALLFSQEVYLGYTAQEIDSLTPCWSYMGTIVCDNQTSVHYFNRDGMSERVSVVPDDDLRREMIDYLNQDPYTQVGRNEWVLLISGRWVYIKLENGNFEYILR